MPSQSYRQTIEEILKPADIQIDGDRPGDIKVHNHKTYQRILSQGSLGLGESYMEGWWDSSHLDVFFEKLLGAQVHKRKRFKTLFRGLRARLSDMLRNPQSVVKSRRVAEQHYDLGNKFYRAMLGETMQYTCAYWQNAQTLDEAQKNKMDLVCRKLQLKQGERVLELGFGWGNFAKFMAEKYGCKVTAYNISDRQIQHAKKLCENSPVNIVHDDYRTAKGTFDKVVSVGLLEHVGSRNYRGFMELIERSLKPHGLALVHTIGRNTTPKPGEIDPWITKYIFLGGAPPSLQQIAKASEGLLLPEDLHNIGADYDRTLMAWNDNFQGTWPKFREEYGNRFKRMWEYYLLSCAGSFRARNIQLWQIVLSKGGIRGGYQSIR